MNTTLKCAAMNAVWLGAMTYLALQDRSNLDPRALVGVLVTWVLATTAAWLLFRRSAEARLWQLAVWTLLVSIVALVFVTISAAFVAPPPPT